MRMNDNEMIILGIAVETFVMLETHPVDISDSADSEGLERVRPAA